MKASRLSVRISSKHSGAISLIFATVAYFVAVVQRSSMGVAALDAKDRFEVNAATLSALGVAQLVVYAAMQIPVGMLLDRFGSRANLAFGAVVMFAGQVVVSGSEDFAIAVMGRMLVGFGDAFTFIALVRLVSVWFRGTKASLLQQIAANVGQLGQVLSAVSFHSALATFGWRPAFGFIAFCSLATALLVLAFVSEKEKQSAHNSGGYLRMLVANLRDPAVWTGFWVHFALQSSGSSFILFWGFPFMVSAQELSNDQASGILTAFVFVGFLVGPIFGTLGGRYPYRRSNLVIGMGTLILIAWSLLVLPTTTSPYWMILLCVLIIAAGGPASMMAFDYVRTFVPAERASSASGLVNMGGFVAAFSLMFLVGSGLDLSVTMNIASTAFSLEAFRFAFLSELFVTTAGLVMFFLNRNRLRMRLFIEQGIKIRPLRVALVERLSSFLR